MLKEKMATSRELERELTRVSAAKEETAQSARRAIKSLQRDVKSLKKQLHDKNVQMREEFCVAAGGATDFNHGHHPSRRLRVRRNPLQGTLREGTRLFLLTDIRFAGDD